MRATKGAVVAKESRNFRLDADVLEMLRRLSESWHVSQAQVIEILTREAVREGRELRAVKR
jgi:uncharacterized protein (DUF4415 family)